MDDPPVLTLQTVIEHTAQFKSESEELTLIWHRYHRLKQTGAVGDNVFVPIPMVDRGRGAARNILGVIVHGDVEKDQ
jgi:hypothetical protein